MPTRTRRLWRNDGRGAAAVELVIATPLLLLLITLVVQFGVWAHAQHTAQAIANEALQVARAYASSATAGEAQAGMLLDQLGGSVLTEPHVTVTRTATTVTVTITARAPAVLPWLHSPVHVTVTGPVERLNDFSRGFAISEGLSTRN